MFNSRSIFSAISGLEEIVSKLNYLTCPWKAEFKKCFM